MVYLGLPVYLLNMVIFHGYVSHNQMLNAGVNAAFDGKIWEVRHHFNGGNAVAIFHDNGGLASGGISESFRLAPGRRTKYPGWQWPRQGEHGTCSKDCRV